MKHAFTALILSVAAAYALAQPAKLPAAPANEDCLTCHEDPSAKRANGTSVFVAKDKFSTSVHGEAGVACVDCHADLATTADFPHPEKLAPAQCQTCHGEVVAEYAKSAHAQARAIVGSLAATCADCHTAHEIRSPKDPASPTYVLNLPTTCGRCHGSADVIRKGHIAIGNVVTLYQDSIHAKALNESGLVVAPTCRTCHGMHDVRRASDPESKVFRTTVPATCGSCHEGVRHLFDAGVHGAAVARGNPRAPVCSDCHTAHHIQEATQEAWRLDVVRECGTCHRESLTTYRDTYHGQVTSLGFSRIATCADCHRAHDIFPAQDPRSTVSALKRLQTCRTCHPGVNENFARYDPHADPDDRDRNPILFWASRLMKGLLFGVFGFFGLHTLLWIPRSWRERRERRRASGRTPPPARSEDEKSDE
jgi:nitrate/TMAO reductase-like tetraheme cytochrome c subunit